MFNVKLYHEYVAESLTYFTGRRPERNFIMKNKKSIAVISAVVGVCILSSAAFASYQTANGYDTLKKSIINTKDLVNCTLSFSAAFTSDGKTLSEVSVENKYDLENRQYSYNEKSVDMGESPYSYTNIHDGESYYELEKNDDGSYKYKRYGNSFSYYNYDNLWGISEDDEKTVQKIIKFMELATDTVVGDLRNNFVCTEDNDEYSTYNITLDSVQIPKIINAGLGVFFTAFNIDSEYKNDIDENDAEYYVYQLGEDPTVSNVSLTYTVSKDGVLRDGVMQIDLTGNDHTVTFNGSLGFSDIGTTTVYIPDPAVDNIEVVR